MRKSTQWFFLVLIFGLTDVVQAKGVVVIGDSLSATEDSWPTYIYGHHFSLMAQGGRTIRDFDIPRDIFSGFPFTTAVYFLGANDATQDQNLHPKPPLLVSGHQKKNSHQ